MVYSVVAVVRMSFHLFLITTLPDKGYLSLLTDEHCEFQRGWVVVHGTASTWQGWDLNPELASVKVDALFTVSHCFL